jgi:hypothetical protein
MRMHMLFTNRQEGEGEGERTDGSFVVILGVGDLTIAAASSFSSFRPL